ncbi:hypothetical protein ACQCSX_05200 [Pseudarthrobacter sp. P1]|uniref:hypothetical protein n=1 Tax=Pseudarthrobacter sp. P1 TaxID=3418418 RepID=UPI003CE87651
MTTEEHRSNLGTREGGYGAPEPEDEIPHGDGGSEPGVEPADETTADGDSDGENPDGS